MSHHKRKRVIIVLLIVTIGVIMCGKAFLFHESSKQENDKTQRVHQISDLKTTIDLGSDLKLTGLSETAGNFPENGSDDFVEKMLSATFVNEGEKTIQYASVQVSIGKEQFSFTFSTLPAGAGVHVYEKDKKAVSLNSDTISAEAEYIAYFEEEPSLYEKELEIKVTDGMIAVKNISKSNIDKEISVYYKTVSNGFFVGGITYRFRIPGGIDAGEEYSGSALHASEKTTKVMFVTYEN